MRTMIKGSTVLDITEHIIIKNLWEYYVVKQKPKDESEDSNIKLCLVYGYELELGDVDMNEIKPFIISKTNNLKEVMPAPGYTWRN